MIVKKELTKTDARFCFCRLLGNQKWSLISFQKVALWENCVEYILPDITFCGRFSAIATESDVRNEGIEHKKRLHTHDGSCYIMRNLQITASLI